MGLNAVFPRYRALAVDRLAQRIDHAAHQFIAYRDGEQASDAPNEHAFVHLLRFSEDNGAHAVLFPG